MTPTTNLANAARRLCAARAGEGFDTLEHSLAIALDDYDAQEILKIDLRSRVTDVQLADIWKEEFAGVTKEAPEESLAERIDQATMQAMRRIANYADHLRGLILLLGANSDLTDLLYKVREDEGQGWEGPKVKAAGEAIAGMLAEIAVNMPPRPVDNPADPVDAMTGLA